MSARRPLLSIPETAELLGVTPRWVRRAVEERRFPYHKVGKLVRFAPDDLEVYLATRRVEARES